MKNKKTRIAFVLLAVFCISFCMFGAMSAYAQTEKWSEIEIDAYYAYGDDFTVPERTVTAGDKSAVALFAVTCPNGKVTSEKTVKLGMVGDYVVRYYAGIGTQSWRDIGSTASEYIFSHDETDGSSGCKKHQLV